MAKEKTNIRRIVLEYVSALEPNIVVDKVVLFGSYAHGNAGKWSDIDIAIISKDLARVRALARIRFLARRAAHCDSRLEPFGYSLGEYNHAKRVSFIGEIKSTGKVIYTRRKRRKIPPRKNHRRA